MGSRSSSTRESSEGGVAEKLKYEELVEKLSKLGIEVPIDRNEYSKIRTSGKKIIKLLIDRMEELEAVGPEAIVELTDEEVEYVIFRLRTIYGDPLATSIVSKLSDVLKRRRKASGKNSSRG